MPEFELSLEGLDKVLERLDNLPNEVRKRAADIINQTALGIESEAKRNLTRRAQDLGVARSSIRVAKRATPKDLEAITSFGNQKTRNDGFSYVLAIEFGARPHFPPVKAVTGQKENLDFWVDRNVTVSSDSTPEREALLVARSIAQSGLRKRSPFRDAVRKRGRLFALSIRTLFDNLDLG